MADKTKCADGTYTLSNVASNINECKDCPAGWYCTTTVTADTDINTTTITACPAGKWCPDKSFEVATPTSPAVACPAGSYCLQNTPAPIPCPPGFYCAVGNNAFPTTACTAGSYCTISATTATPTDGTTGNTCPQGHYCLSTTAQPYPIPCPLGTYNSLTGKALLADCLTCTSDQLCDERGLINAKAAPKVCPTGYFCPLVGGPFKCPVGAKCPLEEVRTIYIPCPTGQYQPNIMSTSCLNCPAGKFCPDTAADTLCPDGGCVDAANSFVRHATATLCPTGNYCPLGSRDA